MSWFERKVILPLAPNWAMKRAQARHKYRAYEAVKTTHQRNPRRDSRSADGTNYAAVKNLREQARYLEENYDLAKGALDVIVNNTVGANLLPEPKVKLKKNGGDATDINQQLLDLWHDWAKRPEATRELDFNQVARLACRSWIRDGECFSRHLIGSIPELKHSSEVAYTIDLLEADYCPVDKDDEKANVRQGIQRSKWGEPLKYYFYDRHPGDGFNIAATVREVNASSISHLKLTSRFRQSRGISLFAPVFTRLYDVKDYEESERIAARLTAAIGLAFVDSGDGGGTPFDNNEDSEGTRYHDGFQPGMVFDDLPPGVKPEIIESKRPSSLAMPFRNGMLKAVAAGMGASYSSIAKDYSGTFSSQRQELVESYQSYKIIREAFVSMFVLPIYERFVDICLSQGLVKVNNRVDVRTLKDVHFSGSQMPWIDPLKEAKANIEMVDAKLKPRSQVWREMGLNPGQVMQQLEKESKDELFKAPEPEKPKIEPEEDDNEEEAAD